MGQERARILVVDDEPSIVSLVATLLARDGHEVVGAGSHAEGLAALAVEPALAVIDKNLPDGSGLSLLAEVRRRWPFAECIVFTGYPSFESVVDALRLGAFDYVTKPLGDLDQLRHKVRLGLERRALLREREGTIRELEEARRLEALAAHSETMAQLGRLLAGIVHEIRSPLAGVRATISLLLAQARLDERERELCGDALHAIDQVAAVTADIRRVSGVSGHYRVRERVDLGDVVDAALRLTRGEVREKAQLAVDKEPGVVVLGAPVRLTQVLVNLLVNAAQAIPDYGRIEIRLERVGDRARLSVADDGVGIAPEALAHVFEPFYTTRAASGGTGLGLSLARQIVEDHGGTMAVTSTPGRGATFVIELPTAPPPESGHTEAP